MNLVIAKTALNFALVLAPLSMAGTLFAAGLPALRVDETKKVQDSGYFYRVIDGRNQAVTLPRIEIDLNEFVNCDGERDKKCVVFSMANRDALSPLSSEVEKFQVHVQTAPGNGPFRFICGPVTVAPVPMYNAPVFLKCVFKAQGNVQVNSAREFQDNFGKIRDFLPVNFEVTFKAVGQKKVTIPASKGAISIKLDKVEAFLRTNGESFAYEANGETLLPRSVALGLIQTAVGYNPCWVGATDDSWKTASSYLKGMTEGRNYNTLLFASQEEQKRLCKTFRDAPNDRGLYRNFLLSVYDKIFVEALDDRNNAGVMLTAVGDRTLDHSFVTAPGYEDWQEEVKSVATGADDLSAYEFSEIF